MPPVAKPLDTANTISIIIPPKCAHFKIHTVKIIKLDFRGGGESNLNCVARYKSRNRSELKHTNERRTVINMYGGKSWIIVYIWTRLKQKSRIRRFPSRKRIPNWIIEISQSNFRMSKGNSTSNRSWMVGYSGKTILPSVSLTYFFLSLPKTEIRFIRRQTVRLKRKMSFQMKNEFSPYVEVLIWHLLYQSNLDDIPCESEKKVYTCIMAYHFSHGSNYTDLNDIYW